MQRSFIKGCCPLCDAAEKQLKSTRSGYRVYREFRNRYNRRLRRKLKHNMSKGNYEVVFLSFERFC